MITVDIVECADRKLGCFDELENGQVYKIGTTKITRESALAFAKIFDPFYFHIDEEAAKCSIFAV
jgi:acyl dehydratase